MSWITKYSHLLKILLVMIFLVGCQAPVEKMPGDVRLVPLSRWRIDYTIIYLPAPTLHVPDVNEVN